MTWRACDERRVTPFVELGYSASTLCSINKKMKRTWSSFPCEDVDVDVALVFAHVLRQCDAKGWEVYVCTFCNVEQPPPPTVVWNGRESDRVGRIKEGTATATLKEKRDQLALLLLLFLLLDLSVAHTRKPEKNKRRRREEKHNKNKSEPLQRSWAAAAAAQCAVGATREGGRDG